MSEHRHLSKWQIIIAVVGVVLVAGNLRSPLTSLGPVLDDVSTEMRLSKTGAGFLNAIPLFAFAFLSIFIGRLSTKLRMEKLVLIALLILLTGLFLRVNFNTLSLFIGTAFIGIAISVGNVIMPAFVKVKFPLKSGLMTGVYTLSMNIGAAMASGFSIKIGEWTGMDWRGSLSIWIIPVIMALIIWIPLTSRKNILPPVKTQKGYPKVNIYKSKLAWHISIFMGLQSLIFYCVVGWLPIVTMDAGMGKVEAGWLVSYFQFVSLPFTFLTPIIASRMTNQKPLIYIVASFLIISILLFAFYPLKYGILASVLFGISNGISFSLVMLFFLIRTQSSVQSVKLSGMAQSVGYLIAGMGPPIFGIIFELTGQWVYSFYFLVLTSVIIGITGFYAAQNRTVEQV